MQCAFSYYSFFFVFVSKKHILFIFLLIVYIGYTLDFVFELNKHYTLDFVFSQTNTQFKYVRHTQ